MALVRTTHPTAGMVRVSPGVYQSAPAHQAAGTGGNVIAPAAQATYQQMRSPNVSQVAVQPQQLIRPAQVLANSQIAQAVAQNTGYNKPIYSALQGRTGQQIDPGYNRTTNYTPQEMAAMRGSVAAFNASGGHPSSAPAQGTRLSPGIYADGHGGSYRSVNGQMPMQHPANQGAGNVQQPMTNPNAGYLDSGSQLQAMLSAQGGGFNPAGVGGDPSRGINPGAIGTQQPSPVLGGPLQPYMPQGGFNSGGMGGDPSTGIYPNTGTYPQLQPQAPGTGGPLTYPGMQGPQPGMSPQAWAAAQAALGNRQY